MAARSEGYCVQTSPGKPESTHFGDVFLGCCFFLHGEILSQIALPPDFLGRFTLAFRLEPGNNSEYALNNNLILYIRAI